MAKFQVNVSVRSDYKEFFYNARDLITTESGPLRVLAIEAFDITGAAKLAQIWADGVNDANGAEVATIVSIFTWREKFGLFDADYET